MLLIGSPCYYFLLLFRLLFFIDFETGLIKIHSNISIWIDRKCNLEYLLQFVQASIYYNTIVIFLIVSRFLKLRSLKRDWRQDRFIVTCLLFHQQKKLFLCFISADWRSHSNLNASNHWLRVNFWLWFFYTIDKISV